MLSISRRGPLHTVCRPFYQYHSPDSMVGCLSRLSVFTICKVALDKRVVFLRLRALPRVESNHPDADTVSSCFWSWAAHSKLAVSYSSSRTTKGVPFIVSSLQPPLPPTYSPHLTPSASFFFASPPNFSTALFKLATSAPRMTG